MLSSCGRGSAEVLIADTRSNDTMARVEARSCFSSCRALPSICGLRGVLAVVCSLIHKLVEAAQMGSFRVLAGCRSQYVEGLESSEGILLTSHEPPINIIDTSTILRMDMGFYRDCITAPFDDSCEGSLCAYQTCNSSSCVYIQGTNHDTGHDEFALQSWP